MISSTMQDAVNKQINAELYSSYLYMAMAAQATVMGLKGTAHWLTIQAQEEMVHALRFYNYVNDRGGRVVLAAIAQPPAEFESALAIFEQTLEHEKKVTALINGLVDLARKENDHASEVMLQWFVTEQIEEEANAGDIAAKLKLAGRDGGGLFMIDKDLGTRVFTMPADMAGGGPA